MIKFLQRLMGIRHAKTGLPDVKFHHDANYFIPHGKLRVSNKKLGLLDEEIIFSFPGMVVPPALTPFFINHIWEEAQDQGYVVHYLVNYGEMSTKAKKIFAPVALAQYGWDIAKSESEQKATSPSTVEASPEVTQPIVFKEQGELPTDVGLYTFRAMPRAPAAVQRSLSEARVA